MPEIDLWLDDGQRCRLHYLSAGERWATSRAPVVLLLHGLGGFAQSWRHNLEELSANAWVLAPDLPGFGLSDKPRGPYGLRFLAKQVNGFLEALGVARVRVVGHSLGAALALTLASSHGGRVERAALVSALVPGVPYVPAPVFRAALWPGVGEILGLFSCRPVYRRALARCFHHSMPAEIDFLVDYEYAHRTGRAARAAYLATLRGASREWESVTAPGNILFIHGRSDPVVPIRYITEAHARMPGALVRWLDGCGHFPHIEEPSLVNQWLTEFLRHD